MVRIADLACRDTEMMMRRSKTSVQLKSQDVRGSFSPTHQKNANRKSNYWNSAYINGPRKSLNPPNSSMPTRRKSIDCTYQLWRLSDMKNGLEEGKVLEVSTAIPSPRRSTQVLPPISANGGRASSSKSTGRSEKSFTNAKTLVNNLIAKDDRVDYKPSELLASESKNAEDFCHGLPTDTNILDTANNDLWASKAPQMVETLHNKHVNHLLHTPRNKASSLHSRSSEGSCNSAAFRAKFASRRRLSLPVTSTLAAPLLEMQSGKSPEFYKAYKELSNEDDDTIHGLKRSQTAVSLRTVSDKLTTSSSNTTRDVVGSLSVPSGTRRDSLQRIEEIPVETTAPATCTINEETRPDGGNGNMIRHTTSGSERNDDATTGPAVERKPIVNETQETKKAVFTGKQASDRSRSTQNKVAGVVNRHDTKKSLDTKIPTAKNTILRDPSKKDTNNNITKPSVTFNGEADTVIEDNSYIDLSLLEESDDDLCDADFREKRIIQWLVATETGDQVEQEVVSLISPSPTNGSRETAIKVVYAGD